MGDTGQVELFFVPHGERPGEEVKLLAQLRLQLSSLEELLKSVNGHWIYEDRVYRFYHQSFKVFELQQNTLEIVAALQNLAPHLDLNNWFRFILKEGTGREFDLSETNSHWLQETRPILEAFFHARYFLEMACKYGKAIEEPPQTMPSGWAAFLYLYNLR